MVATWVIYGNIKVNDGKVSIQPMFYIAESSFRPNTSEIAGQYSLGFPLNSQINDLIDFDSTTNRLLRKRFEILIKFTEALTYYKSSNLENALDSSEEAIKLANDYTEECTQLALPDECYIDMEVLYIVAANITNSMGNLDKSEEYVDKILQINNDYARAYLALGNIYYDRNDFEQALVYYQKAANSLEQPKGAYIPEKSSYSIGAIYTYLFQTSDTSEKDIYAQKALANYSDVIKAYEHADDEYIKDLAAWSYYGSGIIYQLQGDYQNAKKFFEKVLSLTNDQELVSRVKRRLNEVK